MLTVVPPDDNAHVYQPGGSRAFPALRSSRSRRALLRGTSRPVRSQPARRADLDLDTMLVRALRSGLTATRCRTSQCHSGGTSPAVGTHPAENAAALEGQHFFPPWQLDTLKRVIQLTGGAVSVHAEFFSPLSQLMELLDYTNGLMALAEDPDKVHRIMPRLAEGAVTLGKMQARARRRRPPHLIGVCRRGFISRRFYEQFELPAICSGSSPAIEAEPHRHAHLRPHMRSHRRSPRPDDGNRHRRDRHARPAASSARCELRQALEILGKRVFVKGNIDPSTRCCTAHRSKSRRSPRASRHAAPGRRLHLVDRMLSRPSSFADNILQLRRAADFCLNEPPPATDREFRNC